MLEKGRWSAVRAQEKASARSNQSGIADGLTAVADAKDAAAVEAGTRQKGFTGTKTNTVMNALGSTIGKAGTGLAAVGVATSVYNVATATEGNRGQVAAGEVGATLFGAASAWAGAKAGAGIGSYFGPWGTVGGGVLGGLGGAYFGGGAGQQVAKEAYDAVH